MKLIWIYGPPAVGKLTVAKELSKLTGYKIFDNHTVADMMQKYFKIGSDDFWECKGKINDAMFELAAKEDVNLITTLYYTAYDSETKEIKKAARKMKKLGGTVHFVKLECSDEELFKRVNSESRKKKQTIRTKKKLKETITKHPSFSFLNKDDFMINNTNISSKKQAEMIIKHFKLRRK